MSLSNQDNDYPDQPINHGSMLFRTFVGYLDNLQAQNDHPKKRREIIIDMIGKWRKFCGSDIFPCFRLLLPEKDILRMFQLKEKKLAIELTKVLRIDSKSEDGRAMLNWKDGTMAGTGDFPRRCFENIKKRQGTKGYSELNLTEVNQLLDDLAAATNKTSDAQRDVLRRMISLMNAHEMYWVVKIVIKSLKIRMSERSILECWHSGALKYFNITSDLRRVCWKLCDESVTISSFQVEPFLCFKPQMASFGMKDYNEVISRIKSPTFFIEEKIDGERLQIHMKDGEFKYFSRLGTDRTTQYGNTFDSDGSFTPYLKGFLDGRVRNIILDGELVSWNEVESVVEGMNRIRQAMRNSKDLGDFVGAKSVRKSFANKVFSHHDADTDQEEEEVFTISEFNKPRSDILNRWKSAVSHLETISREKRKSNQHGFFIIYDLLYLNGKPLLSRTLRERRDILRQIITPIPHFIEIIPYTEGSSINDINERFIEVMEKDGEGLVVKNPSASYGLNVRDDSWIKIKPEYFDRLGEQMDLVVIGGYYGNGSRAGKLSSFLCAVRNSEKDEEDESTGFPQFYSFCKVGTGFTGDQYELIRTLFDGKTKPYTPGDPNFPACIEMGEQNPDVWIHPRDSIVFQVKAGQITVTSSYRANRTLRFPRFVDFRHDKNWRNSTTLKQLQMIEVDVVCKLNKQKEEIEKANKKRKTATVSRKKTLNIVVARPEAVVYNGPLESRCFHNSKFYFLSHQILPSYLSKDGLEKLVQTHDGKVISSYQDFEIEQRTTDVYIIADLRTVEFWNVQRKQPQRVRVLKPQWIHDCILHTRILPFEPQHLLSAPTDESYKARRLVDRYGDSYYSTNMGMDKFRRILGQLVPSKLELANDETEFRNALGAFEETLNSILHNGPTSHSLLFVRTVLYFDFELDSVRNLRDEAIDSSSDSQKPWIPLEYGYRLDAGIELTNVRNYAQYGGATITTDLFDPSLTAVVCSCKDVSRVSTLRHALTARNLPRQIYFVSAAWIENSWTERTRLAEENFPIVDVYTSSN